jgi:hypothetical protein
VPTLHLSSDGDLNLNTGLDVDDDLLDDLSWGVKARDSLVFSFPSLNMQSDAMREQGGG